MEKMHYLQLLLVCFFLAQMTYSGFFITNTPIDWIKYLGIAVIILTYYDMMREDKRNISKFGKTYKEYMKKVPRANFLYEILKAILRK